MAASGVLQYLHRLKWIPMNEREHTGLLVVAIAVAAVTEITIDQATAAAAIETATHSSDITIFLAFGRLSVIMVFLLHIVGHQHLAHNIRITPLVGLRRCIISLHDRHQLKWNHKKERERINLLVTNIAAAAAAVTGTAITGTAVTGTATDSSRITIFMAFGELSVIMMAFLVHTVDLQRMISLHDRRDSSWAPSDPSRGQIAGPRLGFGDVPVAEDGEQHVSRSQRDRFWLSRFRSDDGELLTIELRSAHAYPSLASAPHGRGDVFVMDSGAGFHVTPHRHMLQAYLEREHPMFPDFFRQLELVCADGNALPVHGMGNIDTGVVRLEDVLHIPGLVANLVSVSFLNHQIDEQLGHGHHRQLRAAGVLFLGDHFTVFVVGGAGAVVLGGGTRVGDVYHLHALRP